MCVYIYNSNPGNIIWNALSHYLNVLSFLGAAINHIHKHAIENHEILVGCPASWYAARTSGRTRTFPVFSGALLITSWRKVREMKGMCGQQPYGEPMQLFSIQIFKRSRFVCRFVQDMIVEQIIVVWHIQEEAISIQILIALGKIF